MPEQKDYHKIRAVSSHSLANFEESPLTFKKFLEEELEKDDKRYLDFGRQIHMKILEPKLFKDSYIVLNYEIPKSEQQKQFCEDYIEIYANPEKYGILKEEEVFIQAYKNNYKTTSKDEKIVEQAKELKEKLSQYIEYLQKRKYFKDVLTFAKKQKIDTCYFNAYNHKLANELLFDKDPKEEGVLSYNELEILWQHPVHLNVPCKSMIDRFIIDTNNKVIKLVDIKTSISLKKFKDTVYFFNYHRQMAFYTMALYWHIKNVLKMDVEDYKFEVYIVAIKNIPPYEVKVYKIEESVLNQGLDEIEMLMNKIAWHFESDLWEYSKEYYEGNGLDKLE